MGQACFAGFDEFEVLCGECHIAIAESVMDHDSCPGQVADPFGKLRTGMGM